MLSLDQAHVTIVGLGLMGGSLALALGPHVARLTAVDIDPTTCSEAMARGIVDQASPDLASAVQQADLLVLATPVGSILQILRQLPQLRPDGCLLLDLGSTKGTISRRMGELPSGFAALGGHPMCGKESSGLAAAEADLFVDKTFLLCRTARTDETVETVVLSLIEAVRSRPLFLDAVEHDQLVALVSHLPYFVSSLLMQQAYGGATERGDVWRVSASGFRDTARLAGSDPRIFADIVRTNRPAVLARLLEYRESLEQLIQLLEGAEEEELYQWMADRQREHRTYLNQKQRR